MRFHNIPAKNAFNISKWEEAKLLAAAVAAAANGLKL